MLHTIVMTSMFRNWYYCNFLLLRIFGTVCLDFFYLQFFGWLGCLFVSSIQEATENWVGVWDLRSEKVCWAAAITYVIHFEPVYWRVNCHSLLFVVLCAFHGFFIYVKIFYHVHMIVPFPVMCNICSIKSIASIACPAWRN